MIHGLGRRDDAFLIGFVSTSLTTSAITIEEAHQWVLSLIAEHDDLPTYIYSLADAKNDREFDKMIGFPAYPGLSSKELEALFGIAFKRGNYSKDTELNISKNRALKALKDNPQLEKRFRDTFPFIDF